MPLLVLSCYRLRFQSRRSTAATRSADMPTLRRILKYTPAVVLGLLVVAWLWTMFGLCAFQKDINGNTATAWLSEGNVGVGMRPGKPRAEGLRIGFYPTPHWKIARGSIGPATENPAHAWSLGGRVPIAFFVTALLPLAIGPFISFRFRLWHYLAYTALVALELAYYLRWQE